ncbi:restriction endonuclease [Defluviitalea saccharophila]|uniref:Restriction endonuclease n=1 Tax=Defluviitalea saccharophila TaxID=879970 RepID=A0ABZ2Y2Y5_9FIRM
MSIPKYHEFMKPILELLKDNQNHKRVELYKKLALQFALTKEEMEEWLPSGKQLVYKNRIGWALTYLKKARLIESPARATFKITELGQSVLLDNPSEIDPNYLRKFEGFNDFVDSSNEDTLLDENIQDNSTGESPQDLLDRAYKTISNTLTDDLLTEIMNQSPEFFEKLVVDLLVSMGYGGSKIENSQVLGKTGDEGIDGIIKEDKLGFDKIYIQAKRWDLDRTVGRPELQKFVGALTGQGATKGAFITTAQFTKDAKEYVDKQHACKIVLIDGKTLASLMIEHNLGVSIENVYYIKRIDTDYFNDESV